MEFALIYDADCAMCALFKDVVHFLDAKRRIEYVQLSSEEASVILKGMSPGEMQGSFHLAVPNAKVRSGERAIPELAHLFPLGRLLQLILTKVSFVRYLVEAAYRKISMHKRMISCGVKKWDRPDLNRRPFGV